MFLGDVAKKNTSKITFADQKVTDVFKSDLQGSYQSKNIITVLQTIKELQQKGYKISKKQIQDGLLHVVKNTGLLGRWQQIHSNPKVICDTAHNKDGLAYVMKQVSEQDFETLHVVFGVVNDKDLVSIMHLLPKKAIYYFCKPNIPRGLDAHVLKDDMNTYGFQGDAYHSVNEAYKEALSRANSNDFIFVGGSTFVVAEII